MQNVKCCWLVMFHVTDDSWLDLSLLRPGERTEYPESDLEVVNRTV